MSKNPLEFINSLITVFSNGLDLIEKNLPNAWSVYSIILLIIVIFFNSIYLVKAFDTSGDSASCNNNLLSSVINGITWTVIVSTIIFSLTHMRKFLQGNLSRELKLTYGKILGNILGDIFYNFCIIGFIYLLSGFIFSFANNILSNKHNYNIETLLTWIWIPAGIILGLIIVGGIIAISSKKYGDIQNIIGPFIKYLLSSIITISIFSIITLITGTIIYHASRISAEISGILFIIMFILLLVAMFLLLRYREIGIEFLNKYIGKISTARDNIREGTNQLLVNLSKTRSSRGEFSLPR